MCWYGIRFDRSKCLRVIIVCQDFTKMKLRYVFFKKKDFLQAVLQMCDMVNSPSELCGESICFTFEEATNVNFSFMRNKLRKQERSLMLLFILFWADLKTINFFCQIRYLWWIRPWIPDPTLPRIFIVSFQIGGGGWVFSFWHAKLPYSAEEETVAHLPRSTVGRVWSVEHPTISPPPSFAKRSSISLRGHFHLRPPPSSTFQSMDFSFSRKLKNWELDCRRRRRARPTEGGDVKGPLLTENPFLPWNHLIFRRSSAVGSIGIEIPSGGKLFSRNP